MIAKSLLELSTLICSALSLSNYSVVSWWLWLLIRDTSLLTAAVCIIVISYHQLTFVNVLRSGSQEILLEVSQAPVCLRIISNLLSRVTSLTIDAGLESVLMLLVLIRDHYMRANWLCVSVLLPTTQGGITC